MFTLLVLDEFQLTGRSQVPLPAAMTQDVAEMVPWEEGGFIHEPLEHTAPPVQAGVQLPPLLTDMPVHGPQLSFSFDSAITPTASLAELLSAHARI
jgi:hypothetical protein